MAKQMIFKEKYINLLKKNLNLKNMLNYYKNNEFIYDKKQVLMLPNIDSDPDLINRLDISNDFKTAIEIYEAFSNLEVIQAADERLWTYLSHVDLYSYMIKRWDGVYSNKIPDEKKYILEHWFIHGSGQSGLLRNSFSGLWWGVYLSVDNSRGEQKYELTKILFRQLDFVTRTLGAYKLGRHKEAVIGILEFIEENDSLFKTKFEDKTRFITKHLNIVGGAKPVAYYERSFFKSELLKVYRKISEI